MVTVSVGVLLILGICEYCINEVRKTHGETNVDSLLIAIFYAMEALSAGYWLYAAMHPEMLDIFKSAVGN